MPTTERPPQSAEGVLLENALMRRKWKPPKLADAASISTGWAQALVRGYRNVGKGLYEPAVPDAAMLGSLAEVLGNITEDDLIAIGREDAAKALAVLRSKRPAEIPVLERLERVHDELGGIIRELRSK